MDSKKQKPEGAMIGKSHKVNIANDITSINGLWYPEKLKITPHPAYDGNEKYRWNFREYKSFGGGWDDRTGKAGHRPIQNHNMRSPDLNVTVSLPNNKKLLGKTLSFTIEMEIIYPVYSGGSTESDSYINYTKKISKEATLKVISQEDLEQLTTQDKKFMLIYFGSFGIFAFSLAILYFKKA